MCQRQFPLAHIITTCIAIASTACDNSSSTGKEQVTLVVVAQTPLPNAEGIGVDTSISATFDQDITAYSANLTLKLKNGNTDTLLPGTVTAIGNTLSFVPDTPLAPDGNYNAEIGGDGDFLIEGELWWRFGTASNAPAFISSTPRNAATDVPVDAQIRITFDLPISVSTLSNSSVRLVDASNNQATGNLSFENGTDPVAIILTPYENLSGNSVYTLTIEGLIGTNGKAVATTVLTFTTGDPLDNIPPTIVDVQPTTSEPQPVNTSVLVTFSEPMDETILIGDYAGCTASFRFTTIENSSTCIAGTATFSGNILTFVPTDALDYNTLYNIALVNDAADLQGNTLGTSYARSFSTVPPPTLSAVLNTTEDTASALVTPTQVGVEGLSLTYSIDVQAENGVAEIIDGKLRYTPNSNFNGTDGFTFTGNDGAGASLAGTATVTIAPINDAPSSAVATLSLGEDSTARAFTPVVVDIDLDTVFITAIVTAASNGTATATNGQLTYTPNPNYNGTDSFVFSVTDPYGGSVEGTASITIAAVNDAPQTENQALATDEDTPLSIILTASDIDAGDTITIDITRAPAQGDLNCTALNCTYTPNANINGSDFFSYRAFDGVAYSTTPGRIDISIAPLPDAPIVTNTPSTAVSSDVLYNFIPNASDPDGDSITWVIQNKPSWATFLTGNGQLYGTPSNADAASGSNVYANIIISATGGGLTTTIGPFTITVADVTPPASVSAFFSTTQNGSLLLTWSNPADADFAGVTIVRAEGPTCPSSLDDPIGSPVFTGNQSDTTVVDEGLTNGTMYCYAAFAFDTASNYSAAANRQGRAQAGDIDTTWATSGLMSVDTGSSVSGSSTETLTSLVLHSDLPYVGGSTYNPASGTKEMLVWKGNSSGDLSSVFGGDYTAPAGPDGFYRYDVDSYPKRANEIVVDSTGRTYIAATSGTTGTTGALLRLTSAGVLDTANFGTQGKIEVDAATSLALNSTQTKLYLLRSTASNWIVNAYNLPAGTVDATFNGGSASSGNPFTVSGARIKVDSVGRVLVAGFIAPGLVTNDQYAALWRMTPSGALDTSFGGDYDNTPGPDGVAHFTIELVGAATRSERWLDMLVRADDSVVVVGEANWSNYNVWAVMAAYTSSGILNTEFAASGVLAWGFSGNSVGRFINIHGGPGGLMYVVGISESFSTGYLQRFDALGGIDQSFRRVSATAAGLASMTQVTTDSSGKVYVGGAAYGVDWNFGIARLNP